MQWAFVIAGICRSKVWRGMPSCVTGRNWHCRVCLCCIRGWKSHWSLFFSVGMFFCCLIYYCDTSGSFEEFSVVSSLKLPSVTVWDSWQVTEFPFFATKVQLGRTGAEEIFPLGPLNSFERWVLCSLVYVCKLVACIVCMHAWQFEMGAAWKMSRVVKFSLQGGIGKDESRVAREHRERG